MIKARRRIININVISRGDFSVVLVFTLLRSMRIESHGVSKISHNPIGVV